MELSHASKQAVPAPQEIRGRDVGQSKDLVPRLHIPDDRVASNRGGDASTSSPRKVALVTHWSEESVSVLGADLEVALQICVVSPAVTTREPSEENSMPCRGLFLPSPFRCTHALFPLSSELGIRHTLNNADASVIGP